MQRKTSIKRKQRRLVLVSLAAVVLLPGCAEIDVNHLFFFDDFALKDTPFAINRTAVLMMLASALCILFFWAGARGKRLVPKGIQTMAESAYLFVRNQIAIDVIGPKDGPKYANYLAALFFFIFFANLLEIVPGINFPVTSRMAIPAVLALLTYLIFNFVGFKKQGIKYLTGTLFPPGVPKAIMPLLALIELFSVFVIRPLTLAIRLLANMMAGHVLLTIFFVFTHDFLTNLTVQTPLGIVTAIVAAGLIVFELMVISIQAYIFTMLTAFYIAEAIHGHGEEDHTVDTEHTEPTEGRVLTEAA